MGHDLSLPDECSHPRARKSSFGRRIAEGLRRAGLALAVLLMPAATRAQQSVDHPDAVVAKPVVNMYRGPSAASDVVSQALYGAGVFTLGKQPSWINVRTADGYTGWVAASDLKPLNGGSYAPAGKAVRIAELSANVYGEPDVTLHAPVLQLPWEARLETVPDAAKNTERWLQVRLVDGQAAWVQRADVTGDFTPLSIGEMLALSHKFIGITYTWGGVSSYGFDCSGFTQMLERQRGIEMPRDADLQAAWDHMMPVERKDLEPGDLLFFGSSIAKITHTGMYLGNGEFIHDTTHGHPGVQISRLDDMPWAQLLVAVRRIKQ
ncbi:MAG: SH3 domain-containing C40 family peptidase [Terracidiphilus sp.]